MAARSATSMPDWMIDILGKAHYNPGLNCILEIKEKLDKERYGELNQVFTSLRGEWKGGKNAGHYFPYDATGLLESLLESEQKPPTNALAYFPTPEPVIDLLLADIGPRIQFYLDQGMPVRILEPSAGTGAIAHRLRAQYPKADLTLVEADPINIGLLKRQGYHVHGQSFTDWHGGPFDFVVMNPPFSLPGDALAYVTHINHAFDMLRPGGMLATVMLPLDNQTKPDQRYQDFREAIAIHHREIVKLDKGEFSESGTEVATWIAVLDKEPDDREPALLQEYYGRRNYFAWQFASTLWATRSLLVKAQHEGRRLAAGDIPVDVGGNPSDMQPVDRVVDAVVKEFDAVSDAYLPLGRFQPEYRAIALAAMKETAAYDYNLDQPEIDADNERERIRKADVAATLARRDAKQREADAQAWARHERRLAAERAGTEQRHDSRASA